MAKQVDFKEIFDKLKEDVIGLAQSTLKGHGKDAENDARDLLNSIKEKLQRWTLLLANGDLTTEDFEFLVNSQKDLVTLHALKEAGLAQTKIEQFKSDVFNTIIGTVIRVIPV